MKLYHYTPKLNYAQMLESASIRPGAVAMPDGKTVAEGYAVSLTKSATCMNLGIPTGLEISTDTFKRLDALGMMHNAHLLKGGKPYQIDHSAIRIEIKLDKTDQLMSAKQFYSENPKVLAALAVAASRSLGIAHLSTQEVDLLIDAMTERKVNELTREWWYFIGTIPWSCISKVAEKQSEGFYKDL
ncbi:MAG: hypothetical protein HHJ17_00015 [Rhodoferax sp.]|uniref:hypothetical protein n=1 Tax=Rhodoferax sp. TaxID=50421 RepID=UPI0017F950FB|nr:hypothetical protein [Rhodoferax sp.]NMM11914.1 hypothetical protein [Rhodoferax sp.]